MLTNDDICPAPGILDRPGGNALLVNDAIEDIPPGILIIPLAILVDCKIEVPVNLFAIVNALVLIAFGVNLLVMSVVI